MREVLPVRTAGPRMWISFTCLFKNGRMEVSVMFGVAVG